MGTPVDSTYAPLAGLWQPSQLKRMYYGPECVSKYLTACLPTESSKAFIVTGTSLATKTNLIQQVEQLLGSKHAGTYSKIAQHAPQEAVEQCASDVAKDKAIDTVISIGGGSPIDAAKVVSQRVHEQHGAYLHHIAIPTTLSVAECTFLAGFTDSSGMKQGVRGPDLPPHVILYDATFAKETPAWLLHSTAIRALDHAVELLYNPTAAEVPTKQLCLHAIQLLFEYLPKHKDGASGSSDETEVLTRLQLGCFESLYGMGYNVKGGIGLSHSLGYAIGSPYGVPHGITSCITLASVVRLKADTDAAAAANLARALDYIGQTRSGDDKKDARAFADAIQGLVERLGLKKSLTDYKIGKDQSTVIAQRAAGGKTEGELYDAVHGLVQGFY